MTARQAAWTGSSWIAKGKRWAIYFRDGGRCCYCGKVVTIGAHISRPDAACLDHWIPLAQSGLAKDDASNLVTCCGFCNSSKGAKHGRTWMAVLRAAGLNVQTIARRVKRQLAKDLAPYRRQALAQAEWKR